MILHPGDGGAPAGKLHQFGFTLAEADYLTPSASSPMIPPNAV